MPNPLWDALFAPMAARDTPLFFMPDGSAITGRAFHAMAGRMAAALDGAGIEPGDRVAAQVAKSVQALALYAAGVARGAVFLPLNPAYTPHEIGYFLSDATPRLFVCDPGEAVSHAPAAAAAGARVLTLAADGTGTLPDAGRDAPPSIADRTPDDLAALLYTSGTTGRSKGAMLTQANLLSNARALTDLWRFTAHDTLIHALPIFHTHGLFVATNVSLLSGARMIFQPGFDATAILDALPQATALMGVPTFYTRLLDSPRLTRAATAHMRLFISGSAPLLAETHRDFTTRTGHALLERYGMTETNMIASNPYDGDRRPGTVGHPLPGVELRLDPPGSETGGIEVRGPNVFKGYWNMPEKTAAEFTPDGWFRTGDLGRFDADGYLRIVGRAKDMVITGGLNVYPVEVEEALDAVPGVLESAVIGLPHPDFGEAVFAVLTPRPGATLDPDATLAAIAPRLARFKQPKAAVVLPALPRNPMGKVQKAVLRKTYVGWFAKG